MNNSRTCTAWGLGVSAILLSPIFVIFLIPLTIGIGLDIFDLFGEAPFAVALCAPVAFVLMRLVSPRDVSCSGFKVFAGRFTVSSSSTVRLCICRFRVRQR